MMLVKKEQYLFKYFKFLLFLVFVIAVFVYKTFFINLFITAKNVISSSKTSEVLTVDEREELEELRLENKILKDENFKVREEFSVGLIDEVKVPVYLLLGESTLYGDFYTSFPNGKTPYKGMNVFANGNIVVGQVEDILDTSLRVSRLGQTKTFIASSLENEETLELQSLGSGLYIGKVSGGSKILNGDTIVMKGYPKAIVGSVVEITKTNSSLSNVFVRTPYNINHKEMFYVVQ